MIARPARDLSGDGLGLAVHRVCIGAPWALRHATGMAALAACMLAPLLPGADIDFQPCPGRTATMPYLGVDSYGSECSLNGFCFALVVAVVSKTHRVFSVTNHVI